MPDPVVHVEPDALEPISIEGFAADELLRWLEQMIFIRAFEEALVPLALRGRISGSVHVAVGQEAVAVGVVEALAADDVVASGHRPHHHALAKGMDPDAVMAELYGRATGSAGGRGGTMHLADFDRAYYGGNGIVGASVGIAMGAALAASVRETGVVSVGFMGDGGANTGRVWEAVNMAAVWQLPFVVVCENNLYAVETSFEKTFAGESVAARAAGFGLPSLQVDGQDVCAVHRATAAAAERARAGEGPTFIEALTYRYHGHQSGEVVEYRDDDEVERWRARRDPVERLATALQRDGLLPDGARAQLEASARERVAAAVAFAESSPWPEPARATAGVYSESITRGIHG